MTFTKEDRERIDGLIEKSTDKEYEALQIENNNFRKEIELLKEKFNVHNGPLIQHTINELEKDKARLRDALGIVRAEMNDLESGLHADYGIVTTRFLSVNKEIDKALEGGK